MILGSIDSRKSTILQLRLNLKANLILLLLNGRGKSKADPAYSRSQYSTSTRTIVMMSRLISVHFEVFGKVQGAVNALGLSPDDALFSPL